MRRLLRFSPLLVVFALAVASCSGPAPARVEKVPVSPQARKNVLEGSYEITLDSLTASVLSDLEEEYGHAEPETYSLPEGSDWDTILGFYEKEFDGSRLERDPSFPPDRPDHRLAVWGRDGWKRNEAVAVAFVEDATPEAASKGEKFLVVFLAGR